MEKSKEFPWIIQLLFITFHWHLWIGWNNVFLLCSRYLSDRQAFIMSKYVETLMEQCCYPPPDRLARDTQYLTFIQSPMMKRCLINNVASSQSNFFFLHLRHLCWWAFSVSFLKLIFSVNNVPIGNKATDLNIIMCLWFNLG